MSSMELDFEQNGYRFKSVETSKGDSRVEISKDGKMIKSFEWPTYKIFNIAAHADDIVNGLNSQNDSGLYIAGSTGFGNVYSGTASEPADGEGKG